MTTIVEAPKGTRERLVDAARECFYARGYHATSLAMVLDRAAVNSGSLYYFFKTKEDLLVAVLDQYRGLLGPRVIEPAFARSRDPIERIFRVLDGYREMLIRSEFGRGCPIGNLALELPEAGAKITERLSLNLDNWCAAIEACLEEASDRFSPDVDRAGLSSFVLTVMEGAVLQSRARRSIAPFDLSITHLRDYFSRLAAR